MGEGVLAPTQIDDSCSNVLHQQLTVIYLCIVLLHVDLVTCLNFDDLLVILAYLDLHPQFEIPNTSPELKYIE